MGFDPGRQAERALDWSDVEATLRSLEHETVALIAGVSGQSRISVIGALRRIELPCQRCLGFAVGQAVVTLYDDDLDHARSSVIGDGHFIITLGLRGTGPVLIGDPDLLTVDYEENPFPDDVSRDPDG